MYAQKTNKPMVIRTCILLFFFAIFMDLHAASSHNELFKINFWIT